MMKLRTLLVLLLFILAVIILTAVYYATTREPQPERGLVWTQTLANLNACCRRKRVKSTQYNHFASIAAAEHRPDAARLFHALALSERLHEHNCSNAILRFGGDYHPPARVVIFRGTTNDNLDRSIAYERQTLNQAYSHNIDQAIGTGNRYAARVLIWAAAGDRRHIALMEDCRHAHHTPQTPGADDTRYAVCPSCGNIWIIADCDTYCPFCQTDSRQFIRFE